MKNKKGVLSMGKKISLGEVKTFRQKPIVTWKDWEKKEGSYLVLAIFGGGKYPSGAVTFDAGDVRVRKTINLEVAKKVIKEFKGFKGDIMLNIIKKDESFLIELEGIDTENGYFYNLEGKNLIRHKDDIPF
jgi:hypothetical protein